VKAMALFGLEKALTVLSRRAQVLAQNLANSNTPTYIRRDIPFHCGHEGMPLTKTPNPPSSSSLISHRQREPMGTTHPLSANFRNFPRWLCFIGQLCNLRRKKSPNSGQPSLKGADKP